MTLASDAHLVKLDCLKANEGCKFKTLELPFDKAHGILETHMKRKHGDKTAETKSFSIRSSFKKQANNLIRRMSLPSWGHAGAVRNSLTSGESTVTPSNHVTPVCTNTSKNMNDVHPVRNPITSQDQRKEILSQSNSGEQGNHLPLRVSISGDKPVPMEIQRTFSRSNSVPQDNKLQLEASISGGKPIGYQGRQDKDNQEPSIAGVEPAALSFQGAFSRSNPIRQDQQLPAGANVSGDTLGSMNNQGPVSDSLTSAPEGASGGVSAPGYVKLSGMVWTATEKDVRNLLHDCNVSQVIFTMNGRGKPTGDGFVKLADIADVVKARRHNKEKIGKRFVVIEESNERDFNESNVPSNSGKFTCSITL